MRFLILILGLCQLLGTLGCASQIVKSGAVPTCEINPSEWSRLLSLDYLSFDQSLPDGGWRKYQSCPSITRQLLDAYTTEHKSSLQKQQWDVLVWHSAQMSAVAGEYSQAITKMEQTYKPDEKPTDAFLWNPYAKATVAFLKRDKTSLMRERENLNQGQSPFNRINVRKVDQLIRCFDKPYELAYSGECQPGESNRARIHSLAIPISLDEPLSTQFFGLADFLKMRKVIILGEVHGTKTVPELFTKLVEAVSEPKSKTLVVLELPQRIQPALDRFLKTKNPNILGHEPFFSSSYQDGRGSLAMVNLLGHLANLQNVTVLAMDPLDPEHPRAGQARDQKMAEFINLKRVNFDHTLVLTGNIHSSVSVGTRWDVNYRPMAHELQSLAHDLKEDQFLNILVRYGQLDSWNCQGVEPSSCGARFGRQTETDYSAIGPIGDYFIWEGQPLVDGHMASLFVRHAEISRPFIGHDF